MAKIASGLAKLFDPKHKLTILFTILFLFTSIHHTRFTVDACSSRSVPKPRPSTASSSIYATPPATTVAPTTTTTTTTTQRPNITFPTYKCPATYDAWYCLNEATCFSVKIGDSIMYNCECASGFMGPRCEYKELDGSYLPKRPRPMLEKASIASGATCALLFMLFLCLTLYLRYDQKTKSLENEEELDGESTLSCAFKCRYCSEKGYCSDYSDYMGLVADTEKYRGVDSIRQHIETIPMSFAIKRSTKL